MIRGGRDSGRRERNGARGEEKVEAEAEEKTRQGRESRGEEEAEATAEERRR